MDTVNRMDEIEGFETPGEYERFRRFLVDQLAGGALREVEPIPTGDLYPEHGQRWFVETRSGERWRLIPPDYPFRGAFIRWPNVAS
jgi:hypothetical protein